jgi:glycerophosphoryl diester phosphodiesterase
MRLIDVIRCMNDNQLIMIHDSDRKNAPTPQIRKVGNLTWHDFKYLERKRVISMGSRTKGNKEYIWVTVCFRDYDLYKEG